MKLRRLLFSSLFHYRRTNLAVVAGVAAAVAVLSGALLVGESVRSSLRDLLFERIGAVDFVVSADRFFGEDLADRLRPKLAAVQVAASCPIIYLSGVVVHERSGARALDVNVYGIDERFWSFQGVAGHPMSNDRSALVGAPLARKLGASMGDVLLLRTESQQGIPKESLYGRRENTGRTVRLECGGVLSPEALGEFALRPTQGTVYSIFVPLRRLQRDLAQPSRANVALVSVGSPGLDDGAVRDALKRSYTLEDLGVRARLLPPPGAVAIETSRILLDEAVARETLAAAEEARMPVSGIFTYMANAIRAGEREIPYSVISAVDLGKGAMTQVQPRADLAPPPASLKPGESIWLSEWAWRELGIGIGDPVEVDYYVWQDEGRLATSTTRFRLAGVVPMGTGLNATLAPDYPGITDARSVASWDPPFPLDLRRIRPKDEDYWRLYRATPKAFLTLARGQELWQSRFGRFSSVRVASPEGGSSALARERMTESLRGRLDPQEAGFSVSAPHGRGLIASQGSTDFGEYFVYFSFFLIAAAVLLASLFFRLGIEQRVREVGTLAAVGFSRSALRRVFLVEAGLLSAAGSLLGIAGSIGYGWLLVYGLRTWWTGAVGTDRIALHLSWEGLGIGAAAGILASLAAAAWTLRGLLENSPRALLSGVLESAPRRRKRSRALSVMATVFFAGAALLLAGAAFGRVPDVAVFFGAGFLALLALLSLTAILLRRDSSRPIAGCGWQPLLRLGARNAQHRPGRSLACVALIASATFIIVSMEAFRKNPRAISLEPGSGTGGFPLLARTALPVVHDPNSPAGREALGISEQDAAELGPARFIPFRLLPGDDASCLNLYAPQQPQILGAPRSFLSAPRFSFGKTLAATLEQKRNPWLLLEEGAHDGTIPAVADANTIQYTFHLSVGSVLTVATGGRAPVRLRLVAALRDSIFQGELIVSESNFLRAFPGQEGFRFFLIDTPAERSDSAARLLEEKLAGWGFATQSTQERLAAFHRVENTYLSTFQSLGALGLVLGTIGLATVLLRNVLERRKELALLRAVGYRRRTLSWIIAAETLALLAWGLACGTLCALLAIAPTLAARGATVQAAALALVLSAVFAVGLTASLLALLAASRAPLLEALRSE